jgi:hypothetical protein
LGYSLAWGNRDINSGRIKIWKALHSSKRRWGHVLPRLSSSSSSSPTLAVRPSIRTSILRLFPAFHPCKRERTQLIQGDRRPIDVCVACASREKIYEGFSARLRRHGKSSPMACARGSSVAGNAVAVYRSIQQPAGHRRWCTVSSLC